MSTRFYLPHTHLHEKEFARPHQKQYIQSYLKKERNGKRNDPVFAAKNILIFVEHFS